MNRRPTSRLDRAAPLLLVALATFVGVAAPARPAAIGAAGPGEQDRDPTRIVVAREEGASQAALAALTAGLGGRRVDEVERLAIEVVEFAPSGAAERLAGRLAAYAAQPGVRWASAESIVRIDTRPTAARLSAIAPRLAMRLSAPSRLPDDPRYAEQWGLDHIGMPSAWDLGTAGGVVIAIVDTGVDCGHEDLSAACVAGYDFVDEDDDPMDDHRHGTIQAGVAAATTNNGVGISGVAWGAEIMPLRAMGGDGSARSVDIAEAIVWAADHGADVINMSFGGPSEMPAITEAARLARAAGAVMTAAAGNSGARELTWPAALPEVMGIAATTRADTRAAFSTQGDHVFVAAPGWQLLTTDLGNTYNLYDGTSEATSFASGFAAMLIAQDPSRDPDDVERIIRETAKDLGPVGWDEHFGWGRIDVAAGMRAELPEPGPGPGPGPGPSPAPPAGAGCSRPYRLTLHAFPDTVGAAGRRCAGCDRVYSGGDRAAAAWCGLDVSTVRITSGADPSRILWEGDLVPSRLGDARRSVTLCAPPPWTIELVAPEGGCLTLCPNTPASVQLDQAAVDALSGTRGGRGRWADASWSFWSCAP